jgi:competence protein ComEC
VLVEATSDAASRLALLEAGDHVRLQGRLEPLEGYDERFRWNHAVGRLEASAIIDFGASGSALMSLANGLRAMVLRGTATLPTTERGLVAGFLLGDTRGLPSSVLGQFRDAGLSHLLAVSGENVAFVLALIGPLRRRVPRRARLLLTLAVLAAFGAMTRWEPSVLRAEAMAAVAVLAVHLGRPTRALRTLAIAAGILVAADPFLVHSVGFGLSCGASAGIAGFGPPLAARLRGPEWLREGLSTTIAAQVAVAPVLLTIFGSIPLITVPANLVAGPLVGPLTMWGLGAGVLGGFLGTGRGAGAGAGVGAVARLVQEPTRLLADAILGVADAASRVPVAVDARAAVALGAGGGIVALTGWVRRRRRLGPDALVLSTR